MLYCEPTCNQLIGNFVEYMMFPTLGTNKTKKIKNMLLINISQN